MIRQLEQMKKDRIKNGAVIYGGNSPIKNCIDGNSARSHFDQGKPGLDTFECVALHISPDLGERIMLSGDRTLLDDAFPETNQALMDARSGMAWNQQDTRHVIRYVRKSSFYNHCKTMWITFSKQQKA